MKLSSIDRKQGGAIAAVLIMGALLAALILFSGKSSFSADKEETATADSEGKQESEKQHANQEDDGKIHFTDAQIRDAGISLEKAGPVRISNTAQLAGEIRFNEDRTAHVVPRLAGVVESVPANLGQQVKKGQLLAVIASTQLSEMRSELLSAQKRQALAQLTYERENFWIRDPAQGRSSTDHRNGDVHR